MRAVTGRDLTLGLRYASLREGRAALGAAGYADHVALAAAHLPEIALAEAQAGDIAALGPSLGIVLGERIAFLGRRGVEFLPLLAADRAFRVRAS